MTIENSEKYVKEKTTSKVTSSKLLKQKQGTFLKRNFFRKILQEKNFRIVKTKNSC